MLNICSLFRFWQKKKYGYIKNTVVFTGDLVQVGVWKKKIGERIGTTRPLPGLIVY